MNEFWLCFLPLFVAVDVIGLLPMFMSLTEGLEKNKVRRVILQSAFTASAVALAFIGLGKVALGYLGVTVADFMIAGGMLLFLISLNDMISYEKREAAVDADSMGAVPIGVPLIVGPAVLTISILLVNQYGFVKTASATVANIAIAGIVFLAAGIINKVIGKSGAKIVSKLASLILAAIAVMMVRRGLMIFLTAGFSPNI